MKQNSRNPLKYSIILLILFLCGAGVSFEANAKEAEKEFDITKALLESYRLIEEKEYRKAEALLDKILAKDPGNPLALNNKASIMVYEKKFYKADTFLNQALTKSKGHMVQVNRICSVGNACMTFKPVAMGTNNQDLEPLIKMNIEMVKGYMTASIPRFPWPPPEASAFANIPEDRLLKPNGKTFFKDVADKLREAFEKAGYGEKSWYQVPDGFALVSRMEQIYPNGRPMEEEVRWTPNVDNPPIFSLESYLKALFTAPKGRYRVIVFVVTDMNLIQSEKTVSPEEAMAWLKRGCMEFPPEIGHYPYTNRHYCKAFIYEFEQKDHNAILKNPSNLQGREHLEKAKLWSALGG